MAYIPSECSVEEYENQIYSGDSKHRLYIKHGDTTIGTNGDNNASPFASKLTWERRLLKNGSEAFSLDNFVSQEIKLTLHDYEITNLSEELEIKIGTYIESIGEYVYIPLGIYKIQDNPTTDSGMTTYTLRDRSVNFDFNYNAKTLIDESEKFDDEGVQYVTKLEILLDICNQANVEYVGRQDFIGYDDKVAIYDNTISGRIYISYLFEQAGLMPIINREGQLDVVDINNLVEKEINPNIVESFTIGDSYKVSKVIFETGQIKWETGNEDNDNLYINSANPYITKEEDIDRLNDLIGFEIDSFKTGKILGNPLIDPYDLLKISYNDKIYKTLAQYSFTFSGTMISTFDTTIKYDAKNTNVTLNGEDTFRKYVRTEIDNVNGTLTNTVGRVDSSEKRVTEAEGKINTINNTLNTIDETIFKQTNENFEMWFKDTGVENTLNELKTLTNNQNATLNEINAYIRYGVITSPQYELTDDLTYQSNKTYYKLVNGVYTKLIASTDYAIGGTIPNNEIYVANVDFGSSYIELGKEDAQTKIRITKDRILFLSNETKTAYISNNKLYISESTILKRIQLGDGDNLWIQDIDDEGNMNIGWGGN